MAGDRDAARVGWTRFGIGLVQGFALYVLHAATRNSNFFALGEAHESPVWPATIPWLYAALTFAALFGPLILLGSIGGLRRATLFIWTAVGMFGAAGLAAYDLLRDTGGDPRLLPQAQLFFAVAAALFIAHHLIASGDAVRKWIAPYPSYFDVAWKHAVQIVLSLVFVGIFWLVLELGAALFDIIGLSFFKQLLEKSWFYIPAPTVAFACAVHLTDVRAGLTRGARTLALNLLSWLMPLMGLIAVGFLVALPFTGLAPLWKVGHSTALLLAAVAALILLLNATYQDGSDETRAPSVLRWSSRITAMTLAPLVVIAAYGLWLRLAQYGLTPERVVAAAGLLIAACYSIGYAFAAVRSHAWMKSLEPTNIFAAYVILAVVLVLFTPIADPARISVSDQVRRLNDGRETPDKVDYQFLRFRAGRYGREALRVLAARTSGPGAAFVAANARSALQLKFPTFMPAPREFDAARITVFPKGKTLPQSFLHQKFDGLDECSPAETCEAYFADVDGDGESEILIAFFNLHTATDTEQNSFPARIAIFKHLSDGSWRLFGNIQSFGCLNQINIMQDFRAGKIATLESELKDIEVGGQRLRITAEDTCSPVNWTQTAMAPNVSK